MFCTAFRDNFTNLFITQWCLYQYGECWLLQSHDLSLLVTSFRIIKPSGIHEFPSGKIFLLLWDTIEVHIFNLNGWTLPRKQTSPSLGFILNEVIRINCRMAELFHGNRHHIPRLSVVFLSIVAIISIFQDNDVKDNTQHFFFSLESNFHLYFYLSFEVDVKKIEDSCLN